MTMKDLENKVGISQANIRYYEMEGLLFPKRTDKNNCSEYTQKDAELLERIKVLRILGIPVSDIRILNTGKITLNEVIKHRLELLDQEERNLEAVRKVCENIRQRSIPYDAVDEDILKDSGISWNEQFSKILKEDITISPLS